MSILNVGDEVYFIYSIEDIDQFNKKSSNKYISFCIPRKNPLITKITEVIQTENGIKYEVIIDGNGLVFGENLLGKYVFVYKDMEEAKRRVNFISQQGFIARHAIYGYDGRI